MWKHFEKVGVESLEIGRVISVLGGASAGKPTIMRGSRRVTETDRHYYDSNTARVKACGESQRTLHSERNRRLSLFNQP